MIKRLYIKNLAIIRELQVTFRSGLNIITGETGAGKSILIDSLGLLLGGRVSSDIIRTGEQSAVVEGEFSDGRHSLLVRRVIRPGGSRIFLNDEPVKLADLEERVAPLVDLHGQHEHQSLLRIDTHLDFLDAFAGLLPERGKLEQTYQRLMALRYEFRKLEKEHRSEGEKHELRQFQLRELESAGIVPDEEQALTNELQLLSQAGELTALIQSLDDRLRQADTSIAGELGGYQKQLKRYAPLAPELGDLAARLEALNLELGDLAFELRRFGESVRANPARLAEVEERLGLLEGIKRKYGGSLATALVRREELREKTQSYTAGDQRLAGLREELATLKVDYA
ncbi:MAG: AAA family ATPase, partial [Candidatus Neomarinimicrobiota bacterium]